MNKPLTHTVTDPMRVPYQKPQPRDMRSDMVILDAMAQNDPRLWVPLSEHVALRPLQFNVTRAVHAVARPLTNPPTRGG